MIKVTLTSRSRSPRDLVNGTWTILVFSDGSTARIQRQNAAESWIGGWHDLDAQILVSGSYNPSWIADTEKDAIAELLRRKNK